MSKLFTVDVFPDNIKGKAIEAQETLDWIESFEIEFTCSFVCFIPHQNNTAAFLFRGDNNE